MVRDVCIEKISRGNLPFATLQHQISYCAGNDHLVICWMSSPMTTILDRVIHHSKIIKIIITSFGKEATKNSLVGGVKN